MLYEYKEKTWKIHKNSAKQTYKNPLTHWSCFLAATLIFSWIYFFCEWFSFFMHTIKSIHICRWYKSGHAIFPLLAGIFLCSVNTGTSLKGQCHEIFRFWFFSSISFPPAPEYSIRTVSKFFENSRRYSQLKVDHRCRWHRWQMRKILNQKNFNNLVGTPLDSRVNTYIHFCLQVYFKVSAAWY